MQFPIFKTLFHTLAIFLLGAVSLQAEEVRPLALGEKAPPFTLPGVDGKTYTLEDFSGAEVLVVIFNTNHCPTAQAYEDRIIRLTADYAEKGVAVVVIQPNDPQAVRLDELAFSDLGDTFEEMKIRAAHRGFNFPYLDDGKTQEVTRAYGPLVTPHVFIFDAERRLRYEGRIDNNEDPSLVHTHDTRNAIDALLRGETPPVQNTTVFGCSVKWPDARELGERFMAQWNEEKAELHDIDLEGVAGLVRNETNKTRLIKVWATWCAPCVAEFPDTVEAHRMYRGRDRLEIITLSIDTPRQRERALRILNQHNASTTNYIFTGEDRDALAAALDKEWRGPIPYTLLIAPGGEVLYRSNGPSDKHELRRKIADQIGRTYFD